jgi:hypothetical protein
MYTGPNTVNDGLVFGYDSGYGLDNFKPTRFYKGKPAVNMLNNGDNFGNWNKARNSGSYPTITSDVEPGPFENTLADKLSLPNDGSYPRLFQYFTPASTATHTFSVWLKAHSTGQGVFVGAFRNSPWALPSSTSFNITDEWVNYTFAVNPLNTSSHQIYIGSHDSHKGKEFLIYGAQLETGSSRSTFVNGTRSATASLIDLKKTTNIDVSNVSFDSTGQPIFDGTDDKIVIADQTSITAYTYETVVKINTADSSYSGFGSNYKSDASGYSGVGNGWVLRLDPSGNLQIYTKNNSTTLINPINISGFRANNSNKYIHLVYTYEDGSNKLYLNGALQQTGTGLSGETASDSTLIIGAYSWGIATQTYYLNGHQPVAKLYNTTLSADEVKQNFNAYKNRFNI